MYKARVSNCLLPLEPEDDEYYAEVYRIYAESIDPREQKPRDQLSALRGRLDYSIVVARQGGRIVGFSILFLPSGEPFCLLEYMAVDAAVRGGGVGAGLFRKSQEIAAARQGEAVVLIVEVDSDRVPSPNQVLCSKRQRFYRRLGCVRVEGLAYELPLAAAGTPPEMDLLVLLPPEKKRLALSELERWLRIIYREVYGCAAEDSRLRKMIEPLADPVRLA